jgi:hypothetical protein
MLHSVLNLKLVLVCIDEVHLFVQFGFGFAPSLYASNPSCLIISAAAPTLTKPSFRPVLFMTATCDRDLLGQLEILTGLTFLVHNIFWLDVIGMQQRRRFVTLTALGLYNTGRK